MPRPSFAIRRVRGFTLVELLVVIGIIALLVSILLPTLNRAREQAKRTQCLSNLRSIGQLVHMYANEFHGQIPIGYNHGSSSPNSKTYSNNYWLLRWNPSADPQIRYIGLGLLYPAGLIKGTATEGSLFYCPSIGADTDHSFKGAGLTRPNPYLDDFFNGTGYATDPRAIGCRIGYSCRSSDPTSPHAEQFQGIGWQNSPGSQFAPVHGWGDVKTADMMKIGRMKTHAIVADVTIRTRVQVQHVRGINVLSADGSARYVDLSYLGDYPKNSGTPIMSLMKASSVADAVVDEFWNRVDLAP